MQHPERRRNDTDSPKGDEDGGTLCVFPKRTRARRILTDEQKRARREKIEALREQRVAVHARRRKQRQEEAARRDVALKSRKPKTGRRIAPPVVVVKMRHTHRRRKHVSYDAYVARLQRYVVRRVRHLRKRLAKRVAMATARAGIRP